MYRLHLRKSVLGAEEKRRMNTDREAALDQMRGLVRNQNDSQLAEVIVFAALLH